MFAVLGLPSSGASYGPDEWPDDEPKYLVK